MALLNWLTRFANKNNDIHHLTFSEYKNKFNNIYNISVRDLKNLGETGLVSIVLPVYNGEKYLKYAINSVISQSYKKIELIIVDDGSDDKSGSIAEEYAKNNNNIFVISHNANRLLPAALNSGFKMAKGEYLTWISHDNILLPKLIEKMVQELDYYKDAAMVYGNMKLIDKNGNVLRGKGWYEYPPMSGNVILPTGTDNLNITANNTIGAAFMYRASVADLIGEYSDDRFGIEDYDYWMRINEIFTIRHTEFSEPLYLYRFHDDSLTSKDEELGITLNRPKLMEFDELRRNFLLLQNQKDALIGKELLKSKIDKLNSITLDELKKLL